MAPEQIEHPSEVDHRADIYALGVVFYQMLTGELPGKDLQAPSRKVQIDVRLDEIVLKAMEKNPDLRYQQASVMKTRVDDLGAVAPESNKERMEPPVVKNRSTGKWNAIGCGVFGLAGVVAVVLVVTVVHWVSPRQSERLQLEETRAKTQAEQTPPAASPAPADLAEEFVNLDLEIAQARAAYLEDDPQRMEVESRMKALLEKNPDLPNDESRAIVAQREVALSAEILDLSKKFGAAHPKIIELKQKIDALEKLPKIGAKEFETKTTREILARDLPPGNRLEVRLVTPGDPSAKVVKDEREGVAKMDIPVSDKIIICDQHIEQAGLLKADDGFDMNITLNEVGAKRLAEATKSDFGKLRLAILIDGKLNVAPVVNAQLGKKFLLSGIKNYDEYMDLYRSFPCWDPQNNSLDTMRWLLKIDAEEYARSYAEASAFVRNNVTATTMGCDADECPQAAWTPDFSAFRKNART